VCYYSSVGLSRINVRGPLYLYISVPLPPNLTLQILACSSELKNMAFCLRIEWALRVRVRWLYGLREQGLWPTVSQVQYSTSSISPGPGASNTIFCAFQSDLNQEDRWHVTFRRGDIRNCLFPFDNVRKLFNEAFR
jgi:hypothetical protein